MPTMTSPASVDMPIHKPGPDDDAQSFYLFRILQSLRQSIRAIDIHSRKLASEYQITGPQLICLTELNATDQLMVSELARQVHLSPSTVVGIVDRLEDKGLLDKHRDENDRRKVRLTITDKGRQLVGDTPESIQDKLAEGFEKLSSDEQLTIVQSLEKVVDLMNARNVDAAPMLETGPLNMLPEVRQAFWQSAEVSNDKSGSGNTKASPLTVRRATNDDKGLAIQFINSSTEWYRSLVREEDLAEHEVDQEWADINFDRREFYIGYDENNTPVGTVTLQFFGDYTYLGYVYVDTAHVGKAYGKQLLDFAKEESIRRGSKGMVLIAHPKATWAIKAYQKYGFELMYRDRDDILSWNDGALKPYYEDFFMMFLYDLSSEKAS